MSYAGSLMAKIVAFHEKVFSKTAIDLGSNPSRRTFYPLFLLKVVWYNKFYIFEIRISFYDRRS